MGPIQLARDLRNLFYFLNNPGIDQSKIPDVVSVGCYVCYFLHEV
jgi:hypothetical protein